MNVNIDHNSSPRNDDERVENLLNSSLVLEGWRTHGDNRYVRGRLLCISTKFYFSNGLLKCIKDKIYLTMVEEKETSGRATRPRPEIFDFDLKAPSSVSKEPVRDDTSSKRRILVIAGSDSSGGA